MKQWNPMQDRPSCIAYYGNMAQAASLRRCTLSDGKARGVEAVDVRTGGGLEFTVLPGRGMDIVDCRYRGVPVSYLSKAGVTAPGYHDPRESQWLQSFFAGMVTTCGLSNVGPACVDEHPVLGPVPYGLHGDISNTGADNVGTREAWTAGGYTMEVTGRMSEGRLHGEHLTLRRTVTARLGEKRFFLRDVFTNESAAPSPLLFFYHINIGHPILDDGSRLLLPVGRVWAETEVSKAGMEGYDRCGGPRPGALEQQFFHEPKTDGAGKTVMALVNDDLALGLYLRYTRAQLPCLAQWKVERPGEYVFAFEPGICHPKSRREQREQGTLTVLASMESRCVDLEIGMLDGAEEIAALEREIAEIRRGGIGE
ncbi:aldose 1-epimerase family protein [Oscillibacter sp.]|uniref:aldose 1-epimerase family protein n=1 Tax=Oscillibacter sp. TaxID=1945593 RepID=UPI00261928A8|nr:aldose 1-epimerase family protein [Oscillibacter sp.]MDD3347440.1 aldose 1-epimerase family protein [Oscillibacter sp.]